MYSKNNVKNNNLNILHLNMSLLGLIFYIGAFLAYTTINLTNGIFL